MHSSLAPQTGERGRPWAWIVAVAGVVLLALACQPAPAPTPTATPPPTPTPTPVRLPATPSLTPAAPDSQAIVVSFNQAFRDIDQEWQGFRQAYHQWRQDLQGCSNEDFHADLQRWVGDFLQTVVQPVANLESPSGAAEVGKLLTDAVTQEEQGLRALRDGWDPASAQAFQAYEDARSAAFSLRQQARARLTELAALTGTTELSQFRARVAETIRAWDAFQQRYESWRQSNGGCDQEAVRSTLRDFVERFRSIGTRVASLARPSPVRTLAERLMEASEKEERALEVLRDQWQPYDESHFRRLSDSIAEVDRLRRQVASDLDQLLYEYGPP